MGALKYSIRQDSNGKGTWKYDKIMRQPAYAPDLWSPEKLWDCVKLIDCPTLVARGDRSDLFTAETMDKMCDVIHDCTRVTIANSGHLVQGDNPAGYHAAAQEHLARASG